MLQQGFTPLLRLCEPACVSPIRQQLMEQLFSLGASPLTPNRAGSTAFHLASYYADAGLLLLLFSHPASTDVTLPLVESCCVLAGNCFDDSRLRGTQRNRVQAVIQVGWIRLLADRILNAVPCMPRDLARVIASYAPLDNCHSGDETETFLRSRRASAAIPASADPSG